MPMRPGQAKAPAVSAGTSGGGALVPGNFANPSAQVGLTAVNGTAITAMRSDAAPSLDVTISPTWTGTHTFSTAFKPTYIANKSVTYISQARNSSLKPFNSGDWTSQQTNFTPTDITANAVAGAHYVYRSTAGGMNAAGKGLYFKSKFTAISGVGNNVMFGYSSSPTFAPLTGVQYIASVLHMAIYKGGGSILSASYTLVNGTTYTIEVRILTLSASSQVISYNLYDTTGTILLESNSAYDTTAISAGTAYYGVYQNSAGLDYDITEFSNIGIDTDTGGGVLTGNNLLTYNDFSGFLGVNVLTPAYNLDVGGTFRVSLSAKITSFAGTGARLVTANADGTLATVVAGGGDVIDGNYFWTGTQQLFALTASTSLSLDASKNIISTTVTGTGNAVRSASPTFTGTIGAASMTLSGSLTIGTTLDVTGQATFTLAPAITSATANTSAGFNGTKNLISITQTGTGNAVLSASPTFTGTITASAITMSGFFRYNATNSTGGGTALLGANSPASVLSAPYTWWTMISSDGTTVYVPVWK